MSFEKDILEELLEWAKKRRDTAKKEYEKSRLYYDKAKRDVFAIIKGRPSSQLMRTYYQWKGVHQPKK